MFGQRRAKQYTDAAKESDKLTKRLSCINRELAKPPVPENEVSSSLRERVCEALDNHILLCETPPV